MTVSTMGDVFSTPIYMSMSWKSLPDRCDFLNDVERIHLVYVTVLLLLCMYTLKIP